MYLKRNIHLLSTFQALSKGIFKLFQRGKWLIYIHIKTWSHYTRCYLVKYSIHYSIKRKINWWHVCPKPTLHCCHLLTLLRFFHLILKVNHYLFIMIYYYESNTITFTSTLSKIFYNLENTRLKYKNFQGFPAAWMKNHLFLLKIWGRFVNSHIYSIAVITLSYKSFLKRYTMHTTDTLFYNTTDRRFKIILKLTIWMFYYSHEWYKWMFGIIT